MLFLQYIDLKHKFRLPIKNNEYRKLKRLNEASLEKSNP